MGWWRANESRHDTWREDLGAYALGQLGRRRSARLREHLADCPACRVELVELEEVVTWLGRVPRHPAAPDPPITG